MTELGTALRELADRQRPVDGQGPGDLWSRGKRRVRRRRAFGAAVAAVIVGAVGLGALLVPDPVVVMPAGQVHAPGFPDQVYRPSRWLAGTNDQGPLGQVAVIAPSLRKNESAVFGVSATTGEYRFLDLPGWVVGSHVSLAPDGKHLAYWITGRTAKAPYPDPGLATDSRTKAIAGMAIYDTVTGEVQRTRIPTEHGMSDERLTWVDSGRVYFGDWQLLDRNGARRARTLSVAVGSPTARDETDDHQPLSTMPPTGDELVNASRASDGRFLIASDDGLSWNYPTFPFDGFKLPRKLPEKHSTGEDATYTWVSRAGNKVIVKVNSTPSLNDTLMIGTIGSRGAADAPRTVTDLTLVGDRLQGVVVLGWHDDHTLLAYGLDRKLHQNLVSVDVNTGTVTTLRRISEQGWGDQLVPALDVLRGPVFPGLQPPTPMDPRKRDALYILSGLTVAGAVLWIVRRRRRA